MFLLTAKNTADIAPFIYGPFNTYAEAEAKAEQVREFATENWKIQVSYVCPVESVDTFFGIPPKVDINPQPRFRKEMRHV